MVKLCLSLVAAKGLEGSDIKFLFCILPWSLPCSSAQIYLSSHRLLLIITVLLPALLTDILLSQAVTMQFALAGASTIIVSGRSASSLDETKSEVQAAAPSCTILPITADVIDNTSVQQLFDRLPCIPDVLINNAGVSMSQSSIVDSSIDLWWSDWVRLI